MPLKIHTCKNTLYFWWLCDTKIKGIQVSQTHKPSQHMFKNEYYMSMPQNLMQ
jgi:hypothetical protein